MSIPTDVSNTFSSATNNALALVTDPYHDYNLLATGYPDGSSTISTVKRYTGRTTIRCPFILQEGDIWNFHVYTTPLHCSTNMPLVRTAGNTISYFPSALDNYVGPVNVHYQLIRDGDVVQSTNQSLGFDVAINGLRSSVKRTVSLGFEIHNTTAELYKQGSLTVYRAPPTVGASDLYLASETSPVTYQPIRTNLICSLPANIAEANLLPNSRTWEASRGAYCVALPTPVNDYSQPLCTNFIISVSGQRRAMMRGPITDNNPVLNATYSPLACAGVFSSDYTDDHQTFSLDMRQVIEIMPSPEDTGLMMFATTAPEIDTTFIRMYKAMFNNIPPGVIVSKNASGDWFRQVVRIAKDAIPGALAALPHPAAKAMAAPIGQLISALDARLDKRAAARRSESTGNRPTMTKQKRNPSTRGASASTRATRKARATKQRRALLQALMKNTASP